MTKPEKKTLDEYLETEEVRSALEKFVKAGVLIKTTKDGEDAYQDNPEFLKKPEEEQQRIFASIAG